MTLRADWENFKYSIFIMFGMILYSDTWPIFDWNGYDGWKDPAAPSYIQHYRMLMNHLFFQPYISILRWFVVEQMITFVFNIWILNPATLLWSIQDIVWKVNRNVIYNSNVSSILYRCTIISNNNYYRLWDDNSFQFPLPIIWYQSPEMICTPFQLSEILFY